jgi:hypothetical protein
MSINRKCTLLTYCVNILWLVPWFEFFLVNRGGYTEYTEYSSNQVLNLMLIHSITVSVGNTGVQLTVGRYGVLVDVGYGSGS